MNTLKLSLFTALVFVFSGITGYSQSNFTGEIKYDITYQEIPKEIEGYEGMLEGMLPNSTTIYIKGSKSKTVVQQPMGGNQAVIFDKDSYSGWILNDMMGSKWAVKMTEEDLKADENKSSSPKITYLNEYQTIAGYNCQKAMIETYSGVKKVITEVYFTEDIPNTSQNFGTLKGMALSYTVDQNGTKSTIKASSVLFKTIPDSIFDIPEDYERMTLDELNKRTRN